VWSFSWSVLLVGNGVSRWLWRKSKKVRRGKWYPSIALVAVDSTHVPCTFTLCTHVYDIHVHSYRAQ
jgi:hypothetical protein